MRTASLLALLLAPLAPAQQPELRWGTDPTGGAPFVYQDDAGNYIGFEKELSDYLGQKLGRTPVMRKGDWDKLPQRLDQRRDAAEGIDIVLNGYELREDLQVQYAATKPYYVYRLALLAHRDSTAADWRDAAPPAGRRPTVGVLGGTAAHEYAKETFGDRADLLINPDVATVLGLVKDRRMDFTVQDGPAATYFLGQMPDLKLVGQPRKPGFYVIYYRKVDTDLGRQLDAALADGLADGTLRRIYRKYGLWTADLDWLTFTQAGKWPADEDSSRPVAADDGARVNPWPRLLLELIGAAGMTVFLAVASFPLAVALGLTVAVGRVYGPRWLGAALGVYVEALRGTPLLLQLYTVYYLIPKLVPGVDLTPLQAGVLGLAVNYSAYEAENYRAGLLAVPRGQMEAALALGLSRWSAIRRVVVPQAVRIVIPPVTNDLIALFKDTSVCSVILITELTRKYNELYNFNRSLIVELALITAGLYLLMSYPLGLLARSLERRLAGDGGRR